MYIPPYYRSDDREKIFAHLHSNPFGIITSSFNGRVEATHLPFVIEQIDKDLKFLSHFSKANPQWKQMENSEVLVIFQGPDAYISPKNYERQENVPTWNYTTVHVRGKAKIILDQEITRDILEKTITRFESVYMDQWKQLKESYKVNMIRELVAFELTDVSIEAKFKLSQNKTEKEIGNIIEDLSSSDDSRTKDLSKVMKDYYKK